MILVTGATGHLGKATIKFLSKIISPSSIAALARQPEKLADVKALGVDVRQGDYDDYPSLVTAFTGIEKLFFISASDVTKRSVQHNNIVRAAVEAGVKHVVYTSYQRKSESDSSPVAFIATTHLETERLLKNSGLHYTILKNALYADGIPMFIGAKVIETGTIFFPGGDGKLPFTLRSDMAEASAILLSQSGHENKSYEFSAPVSYSFGDIATALTELFGKTISYVSPTQEVFHQEMTKAGVPPEYIGLSAGFGEAIKLGEFDVPDPTLEKILGRPAIRLKEILKSAYSL